MRVIWQSSLGLGLGALLAGQPLERPASGPTCRGGARGRAYSSLASPASAAGAVSAPDFAGGVTLRPRRRLRLRGGARGRAYSSLASSASAAGAVSAPDFAGGVTLGPRGRLRLNTHSFPCSGFAMIPSGWQLSSIFSVLALPWALASCTTASVSCLELAPLDNGLFEAASASSRLLLVKKN